MSFAGAGINNCFHSSDITQALNGYTRITGSGIIGYGSFNNPNTGNTASAYVGGCTDRIRKGWWATAFLDVAQLAFIDGLTGSITLYHCPSNFLELSICHHRGIDRLVQMYTQNGTRTIRVLNPANPTAAGWQTVNVTLGTATDWPAWNGTNYELPGCGSDYIDDTGKIVFYSAHYPADVGKFYTLYPSNTSNPLANWILDVEVPTSNDGHPIATEDTGTVGASYTKCRYNHAARTLNWCPSYTSIPQSITLTGM